jgi:hypothetical protein
MKISKFTHLLIINNETDSMLIVGWKAPIIIGRHAHGDQVRFFSSSFYHSFSFSSSSFFYFILSFFIWLTLFSVWLVSSYRISSGWCRTIWTSLYTRRQNSKGTNIQSVWFSCKWWSCSWNVQHHSSTLINNELFLLSSFLLSLSLSLSLLSKQTKCLISFILFSSQSPILHALALNMH